MESLTERTANPPYILGNSHIALEVNDKQRAEKIVEGIVGKRLTYQTTQN